MKNYWQIDLYKSIKVLQIYFFRVDYLFISSQTMQKTHRNREKNDKPLKKSQKDQKQHKILAPEGFVFILSPAICQQAVKYLPADLLNRVDIDRAVQQIIFRPENLQEANSKIRDWGCHLKVQLQKLDYFWLRRFNEKIYKHNHIKSIQFLRNLKPSYSYRQAYFELLPEQKYNAKNPLHKIRDFTFCSSDKRITIQLQVLKQYYIGALQKLELFTKKHKGYLLEFYEMFLEVISLLIEMKKLQQ